MLEICLCAGELHWEAGPGYRSAALPQARSGHNGFTRLPGSATGILFTNVLATESGVRTQLRLAGSGVAAGDVDGDGWCDLYFCGMESGNRLYRNLGGWRFQDVTDDTLRCAGQYSTGAVFADVDGDGDLDLLVNSIGGGTRLFLNDGHGHFIEATDRGLVRKHGATTMALADVDGNGTLDLYVADNNSPTALGDEPNTRFSIQVQDGRPQIVAIEGRPIAGSDQIGHYGVSPFDNSIREYGQPDMLYLNDGHGRFNSVSWTNGTFMDEEGKTLAAPPRDLGLSAMFRDMNEDGAPDIYVCNDLFTPDRIWLNDGLGHFRAMPRTAVRNSSAFSMGVDFADINRDGHDDFLVTDMLSQEHRHRIVQAAHMSPTVIRAGEKLERLQLKRNVLQLSRGDGTYAEIAQLSGVEASAWSWATLFLDVDLDGYEDVLVASGYDRDSMNGDVDAEIDRRKSKGNLSADQIRRLGLLYPPAPSPIVAFRNLGNLRFVPAGEEWGFTWSGVNQGICCADLDNDGDLEVIVNNLHDEAGVYRNETIRPRVAVRLKGLSANTHGIGAKIWLYDGAVPTQSQEMICGGRYLSGDDPMRVFAAGFETNQMRLEVRWRSGKWSRVDNVRANREYEVFEEGAEEGKDPGPGTRDQGPGTKDQGLGRNQVMFQDVSKTLNHTHHEDTFDDFARQPLLPRKLSQLGPGVSWSDVDGDGREDLLLGAGRGGQLEIFLNQGKGQFQRLPLGGLIGRASDDETTVLGWSSGGATGFIVGQANYESGQTNLLKRYEFWAGGIQTKEALSFVPSSLGPLAMADIAGDGSLELFAGGRVNAGRWPEPASSKLYRLDKGGYQLDSINSQVLENVGCVSGALFSDLDGDGFPELILACDWQGLLVFHNDHGRLKKWDVPLEWAQSASGEEAGKQVLATNLSQLTGWWSAVAVGDFDGDGRLDIVAGNLGSNSKYERGRKAGKPLRLYYGDWNGDGRIEILEAYYEESMAKFVPWRGLNGVARGIPWIRDRYPTHLAYSEAGAEEMLGDRLKTSSVLQASWLETSVFLNRGGRFEPRVLPGEAQFAPVFGLSIGDMDGDGAEDIFLAQNFFGVDEETSRYDAGRGVWLRGDGLGHFEPVPGHVSGVQVYGEGRGCALCDYDEDGRVDLAVGQNGAETKLYHNVTAKPGLRVRLAGPPGNPTGAGAVVQLRFGQRWGPAREVHSGGGYWSQDSAVQVLGLPERADAVRVRWPGGQNREMPIPAGASEIKVEWAPSTKGG